MLVVAEADAKAASAVPDVIACVVIYPACNGEGDSVEEHITRKVLIRLAGHHHNGVCGRLPTGENYDIPVAVVKVNIVIVVAEGALCAANLSGDKLCHRLVAGEDDSVCSIAERLAALILHISHLNGEVVERLLKGGGGVGSCCAGGENVAPVVVRLSAAAESIRAPLMALVEEGIHQYQHHRWIQLPKLGHQRINRYILVF